MFKAASTTTTAIDAPIDAASLAAFRALFGGLMVVSVARFFIYGWIEPLYIEPVYHFTYLGFGWVRPWPGWGMYLHFVVMGVAALGVALGAFYRVSAVVFFLSFTYVELLDKTTYLNHYVLVSLLALLLVFMPAHRVWSVDAWRAGGRRPEVGAWTVNSLRAQVGLVYLFAGIAKLNADWLLEAQPLRLWLAARTHLPGVGPLMDEVWLAYGMSWAGTLYDLTIPLWLLWRPSRPWAFASVVVFHVMTWLLFPIGIFPWLMIASATLFFEPEWPRRLAAWLRLRWPSRLSGERSDAPEEPIACPRWLLGGLALLFALQVAAPLRHLAWPGSVNWTEEGFRFSWRVMLIEKTGMVEFEVNAREPARRWTIYPRDELTALQHRMMSTQPDLIHQYAHHLAAHFRSQGFEGVEVRAHGWVAYNGRPSQRFIDPAVDLAAEPLGFQHKDWILPLREP